MIKLTKINKDTIAINHDHILEIECIPESKIIFDNNEFVIVSESIDEIIEKVMEFNAKTYRLHREIVVGRQIDEKEFDLG
jgi:flagellar protein FlbD